MPKYPPGGFGYLRGDRAGFRQGPERSLRNDHGSNAAARAAGNTFSRVLRWSIIRADADGAHGILDRSRPQKWLVDLHTRDAIKQPSRCINWCSDDISRRLVEARRDLPRYACRCCTTWRAVA